MRKLLKFFGPLQQQKQHISLTNSLQTIWNFFERQVNLYLWQVTQFQQYSITSPPCISIYQELGVCSRFYILSP
jgi:hypothetical protein